MSDNITRITISPEAEPKPLIANWRKTSTVGDFTEEDGIQFMGGEGGAGFLGTLLDIINPLQHIPVVSTIYRQITGDAISPAARVVGGALLGGPIGAAIGVANAAADVTTGKDLGQQVASLLGVERGAPPETPDTQFAHTQEENIPAPFELAQAEQAQPAIPLQAASVAAEKTADATAGAAPASAAPDLSGFRPLPQSTRVVVNAPARFMPINAERATLPETLPALLVPAAAPVASGAATAEDQLFYVPAEGEELPDWYNEAINAEKAKKAEKAYKKMQLLPLSGLARS